MGDAEQRSFMDSLTQQSVGTAKQLAPWRAGLPWWVVLVEGIVLGLIGILILIDPRNTTVNVALFLAAALVVAGVLQLWTVLRGKAPEENDGLIAARGAIAAFAGAITLLLFFLRYLELEAGLIIFGLGSLIYGLTGFWLVFTAKGSRRRSGIIEGIFFTLFGVLLLYILIAGSAAVESATAIVGWAAIAGGVLLLVLAFFNRSRQSQQEQAAESVETPAQPAGKPDRETGVLGSARDTGAGEAGAEVGAGMHASESSGTPDRVIDEVEKKSDADG